MRRIARAAGFIALVVFGLFYLQFGLQALVNYVPQGLLALVGGVALVWGGARLLRRSPVSSFVFLGTVPIALLHGLMTLIDVGELPFLIGSAPVPIFAAAAWMVGRQRANAGEAVRT
jgi:hypothetical protein